MLQEGETSTRLKDTYNQCHKSKWSEHLGGDADGKQLLRDVIEKGWNIICELLEVQQVNVNGLKIISILQKV